MNDEEIDRLTNDLQRQLEAIGLGNLTDVNRYPFDEKLEMFSPTLRYVIGMIDAFERHLSIIDGNTFQNSMKTIREFVVGENFPDSAFVNISEQEASLSGVSEPVDLSHSADMSSLRKDLKAIRNELIEGYDPGPSGPDRPETDWQR